MYNAGTAVGMMMMSCYCNANEVGKTDFSSYTLLRPKMNPTASKLLLIVDILLLCAYFPFDFISWTLAFTLRSSMNNS
jgi:hypothetical protein